ncbi:MAG: hypothetical protein AB7R67_21805 [Vicinamibacterales bacterium]
MYTAEPQIIPMLEPADYQAGSTDMQSVDMGKLHKLKIVLLLGAITGDGAVFKLFAGATNGAKTTEMGFKYRIGGADYGAAGSDVFGARASIAAGASGLVLTAATHDHKAITIDVMADEMPEGLKWLTVETDDGSASVLLMSCVGIGAPRFAGDSHTTAVA